MVSNNTTNKFRIKVRSLLSTKRIATTNLFTTVEKKEKKKRKSNSKYF